MQFNKYINYKIAINWYQLKIHFPDAYDSKKYQSPYQKKIWKQDLLHILIFESEILNEYYYVINIWLNTRYVWWSSK